MKAVRIHAFGGSRQVKVEEVPMPRLTAGKALVHIIAAGVNPADWLIREHLYNPPGTTRVPQTLGQDFAGVVERLHPDARSRFKVGDAVFGGVWGAFAEYASVPLEDLVAKPEGLDFPAAASIPIPGLPAWQIVIGTAKARPGKTFLIHGAGGALGAFAAQFAKWKGARVIATASPPSFPFLEGIGVDEIIDYETERFELNVRDVDVVIDPVGGEVQERSWGVLKRGGMLFNLHGEIDEESAQRHGVRGIPFGMRYRTQELRQIAQLMASGVVKPHISLVLPLAQARKALDLVKGGKSHGKIILQVA